MSLKTWQSTSLRTDQGRVTTSETVSNRTFEHESTGTYFWRVSEVATRPWPHLEELLYALYQQGTNNEAPFKSNPKLLLFQTMMIPILGASRRFSYASSMQESTDEQLMQRYANGDAKAFDQLYARHRGPLYRYFKRQVSDVATANDLYQGAWEKIIKARNQYQESSPFTAWMYRIAHNHLVDHYRRVKPTDSIETDHLVDDRPDPVQGAISGEQKEQFRENIISLPVDQRNTLLLKLETGLKLEEIASVTGVSRETVKSRLRYAVNKLKRSLVE